jgi:hypothetical protein
MPVEEEKLTDEKILEKVKQFYVDGVSGSTNLSDRMRKAEDFVIGGDLQWDAAVKEAARIKGKFTVTIPIVKPQIKQVAGSEVQNPQDFIVENTQGGTAVIAQILTALLKQAADSERARYEKSQCFESGISSGQGVIGVFKDKTDDPKHANLRIERLVEHDCLVDPNTLSYNPNKQTTGAKYIIWDGDWEDKEYVEKEYPDKAEDLRAGGSQTYFGAVGGYIDGIIDWMTGRRSSKETGTFSSRERSDIEVMRKNRYQKVHTWWREPKECVHWYDSRKSELESVFLHKDKEIAAAKKATKASQEAARKRVEEIVSWAKEAGLGIRDEKVQALIKDEGTPLFEIEEVTSYVMHHTIRVGDTFLEDRVDELNGVQMFPLVFYWPHWVNGYKSGIAEELIGTQEEINWSHSMALNFVKQMANTGYKIKRDPDGTFAKWLETYGGEHGIVIDESKGGGTVERIDPPPFPTIEIFTQQAMENAKSITGIRTEVPEKDTKALSGKAIFLKQQGALQGTMSIFLNWNYTLAILGDLIVDIIRKNDIFSEDEIREIVDEDDLIDEKLMEQAEGIVINQLQQMGQQILSQPQPPNPIRIRNLPMEDQAEMLEKFQQEMALYKQFVERVEEKARPLAEQLLFELIHKMKVGKYSTKVTTSPMSATMRAVKATETFDLHRVLIDSGDIGLDGDDLIEATDVPNKEKLKMGRKRKAAMLVGSTKNG